MGYLPQGPMGMGGGPPPGNGMQGPPGLPLPLGGPPPHGVHPSGLPPIPPHHGMLQSTGGYAHSPSPGSTASSGPASQPPSGAPQHPPSAQTPPHGQAPPGQIPTSSANGAPPSSSPMQGSLPAPGPDNLHALQKAIDSMEEKGLQEDPRYSQLLAIRARSNPQDPSKGLFSNIQLSQLK